MRHILLKTLIVTCLSIAPVNAGAPIYLYLDGQPVGTLAGLEYRLEQGEIHITTNGMVVGCQQALIFRDRFEP